MREIKFSAWDKEREELLPVTKMDWPQWWVSCEPVLEGVVHPLDYGERNSFKNENTDRHILLQYTGWKDDQEVEVYEGDRVLAILSGKVYTIFWDTIGSGFLFAEEGGNEGIDYYEFEDLVSGFGFRVISNIYEKPDITTE